MMRVPGIVVAVTAVLVVVVASLVLIIVGTSGGEDYVSRCVDGMRATRERLMEEISDGYPIEPEPDFEAYCRDQREVAR